MSPEVVPVLEIGGSHVSSALVRTDGWQVVAPRRFPVDGSGDAATIIGAFVAAADALDAPSGATWGVAMPDPFDYEHGVATFSGVGKFDSIYGVDVGAALAAQVVHRPAGSLFVNDADAFVLGEWTLGHAQGFGRCVGLTLGTGLGTGWLVDGVVVVDEPGVPELGRARTLSLDGEGLEEIASTRGIVRRYAARGGDSRDVAEIARRARGGEAAAREAFATVFESLGRGLGPALRTFGAEVVVVGGSIARAWDLIEPALVAGLQWPQRPPLVLAAHPEDVALRGAARYAVDAIRRR
jgi:glucokinase